MSKSYYKRDPAAGTYVGISPHEGRVREAVANRDPTMFNGFTAEDSYIERDARKQLGMAGARPQKRATTSGPNDARLRKEKQDRLNQLGLESRGMAPYQIATRETQRQEKRIQEDQSTQKKMRDMATFMDKLSLLTPGEDGRVKLPKDLAGMLPGIVPGYSGITKGDKLPDIYIQPGSINGSETLDFFHDTGEGAKRILTGAGDPMRIQAGAAAELARIGRLEQNLRARQPQQSKTEWKQLGETEDIQGNKSKQFGMVDLGTGQVQPYQPGQSDTGMTPEEINNIVASDLQRGATPEAIIESARSHGVTITPEQIQAIQGGGQQQGIQTPTRPQGGIQQPQQRPDMLNTYMSKLKDTSSLGVLIGGDQKADQEIGANAWRLINQWDQIQADLNPQEQYELLTAIMKSATDQPTKQKAEQVLASLQPRASGISGISGLR